MKNFLTVTFFVFSLIFFSSWKPSNDPEKKNSSKGVKLEYMDQTVDPREDFYQFSCGNWLRNNPVPNSESTWGSFNEIQERNNDLLKQILDEASFSKAKKSSVKQIVGDFYYTAMDTAKIEQQGLKALSAEFSKIQAISNKEDLINQVAHFHSYGVSAMFSFFVYQDAKKSDENIVYIGQGGLGLPDRDFYLKEDEKNKNILAEYKKHLEQTFLLMGTPLDVAQKNASIILDIETSMAKISQTKVELRDVERQYNKRTFDQLKQMCLNLKWDSYFNALKVNHVENLILSQPEFIKGLDDLFGSISIDRWKVYLEWHLIRETAGKLDSKMVKQNFYFYNTVLNGVKEMKPRWKSSLNVINEILGEALGQLYVEKAFSADSKKLINEYLDNITVAFGERIRTLDWMSDSTKQKALLKLNSFTRKIGYPDKWKDYTNLDINRDSYVMNYLRAQKFEVDLNIAKLGKPVDRTEWAMPPQKVNAYYNPLLNEIVFPAAILQPPFFDPSADDAVNYGGIGAVIGHELTHGFDDQGSKFSGAGNMENWWTTQDELKFKDKTKVLVDQFNSYRAIDSLMVNGELTLGENIADLGGLSIAYYAYQKSLNGKKREKLDGFSPEQRLFISWGQIWKNNIRPQALRQMVLTNPHSPGIYRVYGPLVNMKEFYNAFDVKKGNKMYLEDSQRAKIW
jgi:putative endopeptidase